MKNYLKVYCTSLAFLSRLPIPGKWQTVEKEEFSKVPHTFWLAGATIGLVIALVGGFLTSLFPLGLSLAVLVGFQFLITGAFHEDGFADVADAIGGNTRERRMEIMADSRLGTFGVCALGSLLLIRWSAYQQMILMDGLFQWMLWMVVISGMGRWVTVVILKILPYVHPSGKGIGRNLSVPNWIELGITIGILLLGSVFIDWRVLVHLLLAMSVAVSVSVFFFKRWLGGANGDCLGAACVFAEILMLLAINI